MNASLISKHNSLPRALEIGHVDPIEAFLAIKDLPNPILLDSSMPGAEGNRFTYITADPFLIIKSHNRNIRLEQWGSHRAVQDNPWSVLQQYLQHYQMDQLPDLPSFQGGAAGYLSYDLGRHLEVLPSIAIDDLALPEMYVGLYDWSLALDSKTGTCYLFSTGLPDRTIHMADKRTEQVLRKLSSKSPHSPHDSKNRLDPIHWQSTFTEAKYSHAISIIKDYLTQGDSYQVNLSQRFHSHFAGNGWDLYQKVREINPAPFSAYLEFPEVQVLSASPEEFLTLEGREVRSRPIKGTRPSGNSQYENQILSKQLIESPKERAENVMIVDLIRNDLGRICDIGSINVPNILDIERHPTVNHLVSTIKGTIPETMDAIDLLKACFPGGSVTGAPKIRSMQIIEELEPVRRGIYCGSIGYVSFGGNMSTNIAIRTTIISNNQIYLQVGGGIVADSDHVSEYHETLQKGLGLMRAIELG